MKALHVFSRIFHYLKIWDFILAVLALAYGFMTVVNGLVVAYDLENLDLEALGVETIEEYLLPIVSLAGTIALVVLVLVVLGIFHWALEHTFKQAYKIVVRKHEAECEECCCEKAPASNLDAQVEEVMKWKNLYVEGIITEREFIDKRNEILRIAK